MNRILVPYDFTEIADHALDFALQIAEKSKAKEVLMYNVIEHPSESRLKTMGATSMDPLENVYFTKLIQLVREKLEEKMASNPYNAPMTYKIHLGSPYDSLAQEVADVAVDMVVMGTSGAEGIDEYLVGSNAERVVRTATCPVITLKEKAKIDDIKHIVFASNFHDLNADFVSRVVDLQQIFDATLKIVKINTPANFTTDRHDREQMASFVAQYDLKNYTTDIYNYTNEEDGIIYYAEDAHADMIALGTNQRKGFNHFLTGSIAEDVVNHAKRPVWTMRLDT
ncbi:MAG: universal stress protein [Cyclobacteriaceae bacterium]|nr:universal stress protein [Cyclobacteriaceae bacterium]